MHVSQCKGLKVGDTPQFAEQKVYINESSRLCLLEGA